MIDFQQKFTKTILIGLRDKGRNQVWLRSQLGISASHMSSVISGEKNLHLEKTIKALDILGYKLEIVKKNGN